MGPEGIVWYVAFIVSVTAHEAAHAAAAYLVGIAPRTWAGRSR